MRVGFVLLCVTCALAFTGLGSSSMGQPIRLTPQDGGPSAWDAHVALGTHSNAVAVWTRGTGGASVVQASSRNSSMWSRPEDLAAGTYPDVAIDAAGTAVVAFIKGGYPFGDVVQVVERFAADGAWRPPITLSSAPGYGEPNLALNADGAGILAWQRFTGTGYAIEASTRSPTGVWQPGVDISPAGVNTPRGPGVAVDERGCAVAVWGRTRRDLAAAYVQASERTQASGAWDAPVDIAGPFQTWSPRRSPSTQPATRLQCGSLSAWKPAATRPSRSRPLTALPARCAVARLTFARSTQVARGRETMRRGEVRMSAKGALGSARARISVAYFVPCT